MVHHPRRRRRPPHRALNPHRWQRPQVPHSAVRARPAPIVCFGRNTAGSYPKIVPDLPEVLADFEQSDARPFYQHCSHVCMCVVLLTLHFCGASPT
jgi:hypothetical protein